MAEDRYAVDEAGVRRLVAAGDDVPATWKLEDAEPLPGSTSDPEPKPKPHRAPAKKKT